MLAARSTDALDRIVTEVRADGGVADAVALDLADRVGVRAAVDRVEELHGRLDGAFNNGAAGQQQPGPLDATTEEDVDEHEADQIAAAHLYLMENRFVTGTVLTVDGDAILAGI